MRVCGLGDFLVIVDRRIEDRIAPHFLPTLHQFCWHLVRSALDASFASFTKSRGASRMRKVLELDRRPETDACPCGYRLREEMSPLGDYPVKLEEVRTRLPVPVAKSMIPLVGVSSPAYRCWASTCICFRGDPCLGRGGRLSEMLELATPIVRCPTGARRTKTQVGLDLKTCSVAPRIYRGRSQSASELKWESRIRRIRTCKA